MLEYDIKCVENKEQHVQQFYGNISLTIHCHTMSPSNSPNTDMIMTTDGNTSFYPIGIDFSTILTHGLFPLAKLQV